MLLCEGLQHDVHGIFHAFLGLLRVFSRDLPLAQLSVVGQHLEHGGQVVIHEPADLRCFFGLVRHRQKDLIGDSFQIVDFLGQNRVRDLAVLVPDLGDHLLAVADQLIDGFNARHGDGLLNRGFFAGIQPHSHLISQPPGKDGQAAADQKV